MLVKMKFGVTIPLVISILLKSEKECFECSIFDWNFFTVVQTAEFPPQLCNSLNACPGAPSPFSSLTGWSLAHLHNCIISFVSPPFYFYSKFTQMGFNFRFVHLPAENFLNTNCFSAFLSKMPESLGFTTSFSSVISVTEWYQVSILPMML